MHQNIDSTGTLTTDFDSLSRFFKIKILRFLPCIWVYDGLAPKSRLLEIDVVEGGPEAVLLVCVAEGGIWAEDVFVRPIIRWYDEKLSLICR
jgi:hypothetical protein